MLYAITMFSVDRTIVHPLKNYDVLLIVISTIEFNLEKIIIIIEKTGKKLFEYEFDNRLK